MNTITEDHKINKQKITLHALVYALQSACNKIAPAWPLENFVAVNPYLGLTGSSFADAAKDLAATAGIQMTLPISYYLEKLQEQKLSMDDIAAALHNHQTNRKVDVAAFIKELNNLSDEDCKADIVPTVADIASQVTRKDWDSFVTTRVSAWAASYFDQGQAIWSVTKADESIFAAWKEEAGTDCHPDIMGLRGFRNLVKCLPDDFLQAAQFALEKIGVTEEGLAIYLHRLLLRVGGWAAYVARLDFDDRLYNKADGKLMEFLSILICWEACLLDAIKQPQVKTRWGEVRSNLALVPIKQELDRVLVAKLILQDAFDLAMQRRLINMLNSSNKEAIEKNSRVKAQAIFCIDVRSEVFRRNLELADDGIETLGFAGFFAFPIKYVPLGHQQAHAQCPVLLKTGPVIMEQIADAALHQQTVARRIRTHQVNQLWKSFKSGAISCFSFVSPMGLFYLPKLFTDSFGVTRPVPHPDKLGLKAKDSGKRSVGLSIAKFGSQTTGIPVEQQVQMAKNALNAMSLTENFARFVLIVGHGSTSVNNPHATGLDCGACGGHTGEANAKVAAEILNAKLVREQLQKQSIYIPEDTVFMACLHDTTTDEVSIFNENAIPANSLPAWNDLKNTLKVAGKASRAERALRMAVDHKSNVNAALMARSKDWSQIRPEWGLAGCSAFVVGNRARTKGINLGGRSFLHSYDWEKDKNFAVLELIMTAPMVVTSWINLQCYASTTDNRNFGSGNKTLHNVTAGIGVLEGSSGDLRIGLPWQSVHDGNNYQHEPLRLNVVIEAPTEAMNKVLEKHQSVRELCDNKWLYLLAMNTEGKISYRYRKNYEWEEIQ